MGRQGGDEGEVMTQLKEVTPGGRVFEVVPIGNSVSVPKVVEALELYLERAKAGEVRGLVLIARLQDESHDHAMVGVYEPIPLLGMLTRLSHHVQRSADDVMDLPTKQGG